MRHAVKLEAIGCFAMLSVLLCATMVFAADTGPAGWVQKANGEAVIVRSSGEVEKATYDIPVMLSDTVRTGAGGEMQVMFRDKTVMALGENSQVAVIDVFTLDGEGSFSMKLIRGTARMVSSQIARENSEQFEVRTPLGSIGIRGTDFGFLSDPGKDVVMLFGGGPVVYTDMQDPSFRVGLCERIRKAKARLNGLYAVTYGPTLLKVRNNLSKINKLDTLYGCSPSE